IRVIDLDMDLDLTPVERVSRMLAKGYLYGSHFLPHDAMATQKSGRTFLMELTEAGLANVKAVPRTYEIWIGINILRAILPRFSFRVPECERGLEALCAYHTVRETSTGIARDEPCHDASSHAWLRRTRFFGKAGLPAFGKLLRWISIWGQTLFGPDSCRLQHLQDHELPAVVWQDAAVDDSSVCRSL